MRLLLCFICVLGAGLLSCGDTESCTSNSDCQPGHACLSSGGVLFGGSQCTEIPTSDTNHHNSSNNDHNHNNLPNNAVSNNNAPNNSQNNAPNNLSNNPPNNAVNNNNAPNNPLNNEPQGCELIADFYGQISQPTTEPYTRDAGLVNVAAAIPFDSYHGDEIALDVRLQVRGAIVTAIGFPPRLVFIEDAHIRLALFLEGDPDRFEVGQIIDFDVTAVQVFNNQPQITGVANLEIVSEGNAVPYSERTGQEIHPIDDYLRMVRVAGTLSNERECGGGFRCHDLTHIGSPIIDEIRLHVDSLIADGACVTFVGPVHTFPGRWRPGADGSNTSVQLLVNQFDWARAY